MDEQTRVKVGKLPVWAQELIRRLELANEPMIAEVVKMRREVALVQDRVRRLSGANEALMEILRCASRGGSDYAATVVDVLDGYEIFKAKENDQ